MKNQKMNKRILAVLLTLVTLLSVIPAFAGAADNNPISGYYYNQLTTTEARDIYAALEALLLNGKLKSGTYTVDLVKEGVLRNASYDRAALMADFSSARDAFILDNADIIYLDGDKLTLSQTQNADGDYAITLGIGREDTYFADGFNAENTNSAVSAFEAKVAEIAAKANEKVILDEKIKVAFDEVIKSTDYALEANAREENVPYVRNPYGTLVMGESVCEGYSRALKSVLDAMGIDNVLVEGTYVDESKSQPHAWNYVRMDDNLWYLLDATMQDAVVNGTGTEYFLLPASAEEFKYYQPDGVISLSADAFEFRYPSLAYDAYKKLATAFTSEQVEGESGKRVSYKGMGLFATQADGKYIIASFDNQNGWFYYERYIEYAHRAGSQEYDGFADDHGTYFTDIFSMAFFALTDVAPNSEVTDPADPDYYTFNTANSMYDVSKVDEVVEFVRVAPVAVTSTPANSRLEGGVRYDATITYSDNLKLKNNATDPGIEWVTPVAGATLHTETFKWDGYKTISFSFTTVDSYAFTTGYYFVPTNLVGVESNEAPRAVGYSVVNSPVFGCPKISGSVSTAYANTPALIAEEDLSVNEWTLENGTSATNLPYKLSLVASEISADGTKNMEGKIEATGTKVLASKTYEISLGLCSVQVAYVTGKKVKVFVPFPAEYNATSNVAFKAYHFNSDGTVEEIECITTDKGIIMMCNAFSPFAVVATDSVEANKNVMTVVDGNGGFYSQSESTDFFTVTDTSTVTVTADEGYVISSITLNGEKVRITDAKSMDITLNASDLDVKGNILEATFVKEAIEISELPEIPETPDTPDEPETTEPETTEPETTEPETTEPETTEPETTEPETTEPETTEPETTEPETTEPETTEPETTEPETTEPTAPSTPEKPASKSFFDQIVDFFRMIINFFKNLFS